MQPWPFWLAGLAIGGFVPLFALLSGKALGVSSGYAEACSLGKPALGLPLGGLAGAFATGSLHVAGSSSAIAEQFHVHGTAQYLLLAVGGALVGYGARMAGGCTSGHSIVGIALGAKSSLVATIGFMIGGFAASWLLVALAGGVA
jgi:uncharacterized membrane protein YedE/YeeE